ASSARGLLRISVRSLRNPSPCSACRVGSFTLAMLCLMDSDGSLLAPAMDLRGAVSLSTAASSTLSSRRSDIRQRPRHVHAVLVHLMNHGAGFCNSLLAFDTVLLDGFHQLVVRIGVRLGAAGEPGCRPHD